MVRPQFDDLDHPGYSACQDAVRVFFDTEFTDLDPGALLVSFGCVSEDGERSFYAEVSDNDPWRLANASEFFKATVLPLLEGGDYRMPMADLARRFADWIADFGQPVQLATDSLAWDWSWIQRLYWAPGIWPSNLDPKPLLLISGDIPDFDIFEKGVEAAFASGLRRHHALDDAKANRWGWLECEAVRLGRTPCTP